MRSNGCYFILFVLLGIQFSCIQSQSYVDKSNIINCDLLKPLRYEMATSEVIGTCLFHFFSKGKEKQGALKKLSDLTKAFNEYNAYKVKEHAYYLDVDGYKIAVVPSIKAITYSSLSGKPNQILNLNQLLFVVQTLAAMNDPVGYFRKEFNLNINPSLFVKFPLEKLGQKLNLNLASLSLSVNSEFFQFLSWPIFKLLTANVGVADCGENGLELFNSISGVDKNVDINHINVCLSSFNKLKSNFSNSDYFENSNSIENRKLRLYNIPNWVSGFNHESRHSLGFNHVDCYGTAQFCDQSFFKGSDFSRELMAYTPLIKNYIEDDHKVSLKQFILGSFMLDGKMPGSYSLSVYSQYFFLVNMPDPSLYSDTSFPTSYDVDSALYSLKNDISSRFFQFVSLDSQVQMPESKRMELMNVYNAYLTCMIGKNVSTSYQYLPIAEQVLFKPGVYVDCPYELINQKFLVSQNSQQKPAKKLGKICFYQNSESEC